LLERAAAYSGRSVTDFVISHAEAAARKVVEQLERLHLDEEQSRRLVEALLFPKKPVKKLREAIARHRKQVTSR